MFDRTFPILGSGEKELIGRSNLIEQILSSLWKPVPDHLQIVGGRYAGKTTLLHKLKHLIRSDSTSAYSMVVLWDLGHVTPNTDTEFLSQFAQKLSESLKELYPDYSMHLADSTDTPYQDIAEVLGILNEETKILVILDGFDKPLSSNKLTRNLWDQLRELAQNKSLRFITSSRKTLRELIRNPDAQTSDFWNIFLSTPVRVDCFSETEIEDILVGHCSRHFEKGALTEILNNTNGHPIVFFELLNYIFFENKDGKITSDCVQKVIKKSFDSIINYIDDLWNDCSPSTQDTVRLIVEHNEAHGISTADSLSIIEKGFARQSGNKLVKPSRMLQMYLAGLPNEVGSIDRLFKTYDAYSQNFNDVISRRIAQISGLDTTLARYLNRCVEDLPNHPVVCLAGVRGIIDQCFTLIWDAEFGGKSVPIGLIDFWRYNNESTDVQDFKTHFPQGAKRLKLLKLLTGSERSNAAAKVISKSTYVAMSAIYPFGDFGQHQEDEKMNLALVYSAVLLCVELVSSLQSDLSANP